MKGSLKNVLGQKWQPVITNYGCLKQLLIVEKHQYDFSCSLHRRWIPNPGVPCSKPLGGSKVDSAFHPSEVDKMSTRNFWELNGKK